MSQIEFTNNFNEMRSLLMAFALRLTKDSEDAQDLLQETAYKAFKYRSLFEPHTNLRAWLMTIMRNTFINNYRKQKRRQTLSDNTTTQYFLNRGRDSVFNEGEANVTVEELQQAINQLNPVVRTPFLMHYQGYKYDEVADALGIPLGTVKSRIFFARQELKAQLKRLYETERIEELLN